MWTEPITLVLPRLTSHEHYLHRKTCGLSVTSSWAESHAMNHTVISKRGNFLTCLDSVFKKEGIEPTMLWTTRDHLFAHWVTVGEVAWGILSLWVLVESLALSSTLLLQSFLFLTFVIFIFYIFHIYIYILYTSRPAASFQQRVGFISHVTSAAKTRLRQRTCRAIPRRRPESVLSLRWNHSNHGDVPETRFLISSLRLQEAHRPPSSRFLTRRSLPLHSSRPQPFDQTAISRFVCQRERLRQRQKIK